MTKKKYHCNNCDEIEEPKRWHNKWEIILLDIFLLAITFWLLFIPFTIYYLLTMNKKVCRVCGSGQIYPLSSKGEK